MSKLTFDDNELKEVVYVALKEKISSAINYQEMHRIIDSVITERGDELKNLLLECVDEVLVDQNMREVIKDEFRHKVAKNLVAKLEGAVEKSVNDYRNNPVLRAKLTIAIEKIVSEQS